MKKADLLKLKEGDIVYDKKHGYPFKFMRIVKGWNGMPGDGAFDWDKYFLLATCDFMPETDYDGNYRNPAYFEAKEIYGDVNPDKRKWGY